jgi:8-oxo-dGTP diphosphatase
MAKNDRGQFIPDGLSVDAIIIQNKPTEHAIITPHVLLVKRKKDPHQGKWAFPGGFVNQYEELYDACLREAREETHADISPYCASRPIAIRSGKELNDPRGWIVASAFIVLIPNDENINIIPDDDAEDANWFPVYDVIHLKRVEMAFDHLNVLDKMVPGHLKY